MFNALGFSIRIAEMSKVLDLGPSESPVDSILEFGKRYTMADVDESELIKHRSFHGEPSGLWGLFYDPGAEVYIIWAYSYKKFEDDPFMDAFVRGHEEFHIIEGVMQVNGGVYPPYKEEVMGRLERRMPGLVKDWDSLDSDVRADCGGLYAVLRYSEYDEAYSWLKEYEGIAERVEKIRGLLDVGRNAKD